MPAVLLALPTILQLIPVVTTGIESLMAFVTATRTAAQQSGDWTPELEKQFVDSLIAKASSPAWKTDAQIVAGK